MKREDVIIIGGGFYGCMLALFFRSFFDRIVILEKENELLTKASYNNQARVHNGYHYPRSFITALRSHLNLAKFISDFKVTIDDSYLMTYAIAARGSKVTGRQFLKFFEQVGAPLYRTPAKIQKLFNPNLIEDSFIVEEFVFNAKKLRDVLVEKLGREKIKVMYKSEVIKITKNKKNTISVTLTNGKTLIATHVINCTYSQINTILANSHLPLLPFKHEMTEMPLIKVPTLLRKFGVTIMDGPFFSVLPFPDQKLHTIHHVRYTPHESWIDKGENMGKLPARSHFSYMLKDAQRYIPMLSEMEYVDSLYEVKTVLLQNEITDRRPILFKRNHGMKNLHVVMGGKIDNVYDVIEEMKNGLD